MIDKSELIRVPAFADLPDDQITWFLSQSQETHVKAGETYVRQGDPADWMFVILEGQFQWRGEFGGETVVLSAKVGDVTGVLAGVTAGLGYVAHRQHLSTDVYLPLIDVRLDLGPFYYGLLFLVVLPLLYFLRMAPQADPGARHDMHVEI